MLQSKARWCSSAFEVGKNSYPDLRWYHITLLTLIRIYSFSNINLESYLTQINSSCKGSHVHQRVRRSCWEIQWISFLYSLKSWWISVINHTRSFTVDVVGVVGCGTHIDCHKKLTIYNWYLAKLLIYLSWFFVYSFAQNG